MTTDTAFMRHALVLARRGLGATAPNPSVGCVIVANGRIEGRGWTQPGGRPHAETEALKAAGTSARGATAYVTLEPCAHTGQTGPCARALIDAGIARVVSAVEDPDPRVAGRGHQMLRDAGVSVTTGICAQDATALNAGFLKRAKTGQPFVTVKIASSLDGRTALSDGTSQWITGAAARAAGHQLRATHDGILTGIGTVLADDPQLDCRLPGLASRSPVRFVADSVGRLPAKARLLTAPPGGRIFHLTAMPVTISQAAEMVLLARTAGGRLDPQAMLTAIGARGITRLLVEAGPALTTTFVRNALADEIVWFRSTKMLGGDARPAIDALDVKDLGRAPEYRRVSLARVGEDVMETYARRP